jgi:hypothetical protein
VVHSSSTGRLQARANGISTGKIPAKLIGLQLSCPWNTTQFRQFNSGIRTGKMSGELANVALMEPMYPDVRPEFENAVLDLVSEASGFAQQINIAQDGGRPCPRDELLLFQADRRS